MSETEERQIRYWCSMLRSAQQIDKAGPNPFGESAKSLVCTGRDFLAFATSPAGRLVLYAEPGDAVFEVVADVDRAFGINRVWVYGGEVGTYYPHLTENPTPKELANLAKRGAK